MHCDVLSFITLTLITSLCEFTDGATRVAHRMGIMRP